MQSQAYGNLDTNDTLTRKQAARFINNHGLDFSDFTSEVNPNRGDSYSVGLIECWLGY